MIPVELELFQARMKCPNLSQTEFYAKAFIAWLDQLDPALLDDADFFAEQLMVRASRLYEWAEKKKRKRKKAPNGLLTRKVP